MFSTDSSLPAAQATPLFSVEFFPPKTAEGSEQLLETAGYLQEFTPDFVSITYGAGGSTRERTLEYGLILQQRYGYTVMPHLTCVGHSRTELRNILSQLSDHGFKHIMALRGDPPAGQKAFEQHPDGLRFATDLVRLIKNEYPALTIGVGGYPEKHPEASDLPTDLHHLKTKVDAGATFITTQLFFDNNDYFAFVDQCRAIGITAPIVPGIMSPLSLSQAERFCNFCGAHLPTALRDQLAATDGSAEESAQVGIEWARRQIDGLLAKGVPGIHLYCLNRVDPVRQLAAHIRSAPTRIPKDSSQLKNE